MPELYPVPGLIETSYDQKFYMAKFDPPIPISKLERIATVIGDYFDIELVGDDLDVSTVFYKKRALGRNREQREEMITEFMVSAGQMINYRLNNIVPFSQIKSKNENKAA